MCGANFMIRIFNFPAHCNRSVEPSPRARKNSFVTNKNVDRHNKNFRLVLTPLSALASNWVSFISYISHRHNRQMRRNQKCEYLTAIYCILSLWHLFPLVNKWHQSHTNANRFRVAINEDRMWRRPVLSIIESGQSSWNDDLAVAYNVLFIPRSISKLRLK